MSQLALYRKYRPQTFDEVLGQDHIVGVLKNAVKSKRISHAYLFSGPRGTGKTSVARILARAIGCSDVDLIEIDAASSRGIDEIRALRGAVRFSPMQGDVKVYIIDEVHMLSKDAFNALLKTLEEPPAHVVFILATTETEKVLETIISRCQTFSFHKIPEDVLRKSIIKIAKEENYSIDDEGAGLVALLADGSFRDAQGTLDKLFSIGEKKLTGENVRKFLSAPSRELVENVINAMTSGEAEKGLLAIKEVAENNLDINLFTKLILRDVRSILLMQLAPETEKNLKESLGEREFNFLKNKKNEISQTVVENILKAVLESFSSRPNSYLPQLPLELAFIKIVNMSK